MRTTEGKSRSNKDGTARQVHQWCLLFISSGEISLAEKLTEIGQRPHAGQEVRLIDIPADAGKGMGIVEYLHHIPDAGQFTMHIQQVTNRHYGHAGRIFLQKLTEQYEFVLDAIEDAQDAFIHATCAPQADGQVRRVAMRFALCGLAGQLAAEYGILPFQGQLCLEAAKRCFNDWLAWRGGIGASEDTAILNAVSLFIEQHGSSRFQELSPRGKPQGKSTEKCPNRLGYKRINEEGQTEYCILQQSFQSEIIKGHNLARALDILCTNGLLQKDSENRPTRVIRTPDMGRTRCYVIAL